MSDFLRKKIAEYQCELDRAHGAFLVALEQERHEKLAPLAGEADAYRKILYQLRSTQGLNIRLVLLDGIRQCVSEMRKKPHTLTHRIELEALVEMLCALEWG